MPFITEKFVPFGFFCLTFCEIESRKKIRILLVLTSLLCVGIETTQYILTIGEAQLLDVLTDLFGAMIGYWVALTSFQKVNYNKRADSSGY